MLVESISEVRETMARNDSEEDIAKSRNWIMYWLASYIFAMFFDSVGVIIHDDTILI